MRMNRRVIDRILLIWTTSTILFPFVEILGNECLTLKNHEELCGRIELKSYNLWTNNEVIVNDSLHLNLGDVEKLKYDGELLVRVEPGEMLSDFAFLRREGRLSLYEERESFESGTKTFYNAKSKYFSITSDTLYYFNLKNLRRHLHGNQASREYLRIANTKRWIAVGIRVTSIIPFMVGLRNTRNENVSNYLIPFGLGITMLITPTITLRPAVKRNIEQAIETYNNE